jgi:two-component system LytT family response regulator
MSAFAGRIGNFLREFQEFNTAPNRELRIASGKGTAHSDYITRIGVPTKDRIVLVQVGEIDWIEAADYCVKIHIAGKSYSLRETLTRFEAKLDPLQFIRIHRSTIVRVDAIREIEPFFGGESVAVLHDGRKLKVGRTYRNKLKKLTHTID